MHKDKTKKHNSDDKETEKKFVKVHSQVKKAIILIVLVVSFLISVLSLAGSAGIIGEYIKQGLSSAFGAMSWVFPITLFFAIVLFVKNYILRHSPVFSLYQNIALFILSISFFGIAQMFGVNAGLVGFYIGYSLLKYTGLFAGVIILCALILISVLIILNIPIFERIARMELVKRTRHIAHNSDSENKHSDDDEEEYEDEDIEEESEPAIEQYNHNQKSIKHNEKSSNEAKKKKIFNRFRKSQDELWKMPAIDLLETETGKSVSSGNIEQNKNIIKRTLANFGIEVKMGDAQIGPTVTQYTFRPAQGIKLSRITALQKDLSMALAVHPLRIEAPIPGKSLVGIEVPNAHSSIVRLRELLSSNDLKKAKKRGSSLQIALGKDVAGMPVYADLSKMPHLLISGSTGSGKTICINAIILSLLYQNTPDDLRFIFIDPKRVELSLYNGIPHLLSPVISGHEESVEALKWAIEEMEDRFKTLEQARVRDKSHYPGKMPYIVVIIDELADLMMHHGREIEGAIVRLAQMARAVGIHLIVSTQRPSVEVITGLIKANITSRIAFQVASQVDSRTILDVAGAEKLLGKGDMLFLSGNSNKPKRVQGALVTQKEIKRVAQKLVNMQNTENSEQNQSKSLESRVSHINKNESADLEYSNNNTGQEESSNNVNTDIPKDELYDNAVEVVRQANRASASLLQRRLGIGYARAARLLDLLEANGIVGPHQGARAREVFK